MTLCSMHSGPSAYNVELIQRLRSLLAPHARSDDLSLSSRFALLCACGRHIVPEYRFKSPFQQWWGDPDLRQMLARFPEEIGGMNNDRKWNLGQLLRLVEAVPGDTAECGVYRGASSYVILQYLYGKPGKNAPPRRHHIFDSFEGLSTPSEKDGPHWTEGDLSAGEDVVNASLSEYAGNFTLHKGWIPDRFDAIKDRVFAFVHIDVDLYEPTRDSLAFFYSRMAEGGIILCDDYGMTSCPGATRVFDEFFADRPEKPLRLADGGGYCIKGCRTHPGMRDFAPVSPVLGKLANAVLEHLSMFADAHLLPRPVTLLDRFVWLTACRDLLCPEYPLRWPQTDWQHSAAWRHFGDVFPQRTYALENDILCDCAETLRRAPQGGSLVYYGEEETDASNLAFLLRATEGGGFFSHAHVFLKNAASAGDMACAKAFANVRFHGTDPWSLHDADELMPVSCVWLGAHTPESARGLLASVYPRIADGGVFLVKDYGLALPESEAAHAVVDTFLQDRPEKMLTLASGGGFFVKAARTGAQEALSPGYVRRRTRDILSFTRSRCSANAAASLQIQILESDLRIARKNLHDCRAMLAETKRSPVHAAERFVSGLCVRLPARMLEPLRRAWRKIRPAKQRGLCTEEASAVRIAARAPGVEDALEQAVRVVSSQQELLRQCFVLPRNVLDFGYAGNHLVRALCMRQQGADVAVILPRMPVWDASFHTRLYAGLFEIYPDLTILRDLLHEKRFDRLFHMIESDCARFDFAEAGSFNMIYSDASLQTTQDPPQLCRELFRLSAFGCKHFHQFDLRDRRNPHAPLEHLLLAPEEFKRNPEIGSRCRKSEWLHFFRQAGFAAVSVKSENHSSSEEYFKRFVKNLHASSSAYKDWPEDDLRVDSFLAYCVK